MAIASSMAFPEISGAQIAHRLSGQDIDLRTIRIVDAIGETGSVTGAARALGISQPAVSQHLARIESKFGIRLVQRRGRITVLTEAGRALTAVAPRIEQALDDAAQDLLGLASAQTGSIALAAFPSASSTIVPTLLSDLRRIRPGLAIGYTEAEPADALRLLEDREADAAIVCTYPGDELLGALESPRVAATQLYRDELLLVFPSDHPLASEPMVDLDALEDDEWIVGCPKCRGYALSACAEAGFRPRIAYETDNFLAVLNLVARGLGVAVLPRLSISAAIIPAGATVTSVTPPASRTIYFATSEDGLRNPAVRALARALRTIDGAAWNLTRVS